MAEDTALGLVMLAVMAGLVVVVARTALLPEQAARGTTAEHPAETTPVAVAGIARLGLAQAAVPG